MEFLDRYLRAVASYLPETQKDDIIKELSENIHSQIEDRESELGRPLNDDEVEAILKQHGHPLIVAGGYRQDQRSVAFGPQWIGPILFPFYTKVLKFNLGITSLVLIIVFPALYASGQPVTISGFVSACLYQVLIQFAIVTIIFAGVDKHLTKYPDRWDPRSTREVRYPKFEVAPNGLRVSRMESIAQLIALSVSIIWFRAIQQSPFLILGPASANLTLAPVWHQFYLPVVILALAGIVQAGINLLRPDWIQLRNVFHVGMNTAALAMWSLLFKAGHWVELSDTGANRLHDYAATLGIINRSFFYGLLIAVVISAFQLFRELRRLVRGARESIPSRAA